MRKQKNSLIIPEELASKYKVLTAPEPGQLTFPKPFPHVAWNDVRIEPEPALPNPCPVHKSSPTHKFYVDNDPSQFQSVHESKSKPKNSDLNPSIPLGQGSPMVSLRQEQNSIMKFAVPFLKMLALCMLWRAQFLSDFYAVFCVHQILILLPL